MRNAIGHRVLPGGVIAAQQIGVEAFAQDLHHKIVPDHERHRFFDVALEGQVHIALVEHHLPVDTARQRKTQAQPRGPISHLPGLIDKPRGTTHRRTGHADLEVGAAVGVHMHPLRIREFVFGLVHHRTQSGVGLAAFQHFRVLVADHENAGALAQDRSQLFGMQQAFHGAVDHGVCARQRVDHRPHATDRQRCAGGAHRHMGGDRRAGHDDMECAGPDLVQGQFGQPHIDLARLRFRKDRHHIARLDLAQAEGAHEHLDPLAFDALCQHVLSCSFTNPFITTSKGWTTTRSNKPAWW